MILNYNQVLHSFKPEAEGDFMKIYKLHNGSYVIYKTNDGVECIDCLEFKNLEPIDLLVALDVDSSSVISTDEFNFKEKATREEVIKYLFDIGKMDDDTGKIEHSVQPFNGFLLKDTGGKERNVFQNNNKLLMDNHLSYQTNQTEHNCSLDQVFITFDPNQYDRLISDQLINSEYLIYLLASPSRILFNMIYSDDKTYYVKIGQENPINVLRLYGFFMNKNISDSICIDIDSSQIAIGFDKEVQRTESILNLAADIQKHLRKDFGDDLKIVYQLKQHERYCYVVFRNVRKFVSLFNYYINQKLELNLAVYE